MDLPLELEYHTTKEIFGFKIFDDKYIIEIERLDPRLHPLEECIESLGTKLYKVVDGQMLPFQNTEFMDQMIPFLVKEEGWILIKNTSFMDRLKYKWEKFKAKYEL